MHAVLMKKPGFALTTVWPWLVRCHTFVFDPHRVDRLDVHHDSMAPCQCQSRIDRHIHFTKTHAQLLGNTARAPNTHTHPGPAPPGHPPRSTPPDVSRTLAPWPPARRSGPAAAGTGTDVDVDGPVPDVVIVMIGHPRVSVIESPTGLAHAFPHARPPRTKDPRAEGAGGSSSE